MLIRLLRLPKNKNPCELDRIVVSLLNELGAVKSLWHQNPTFVYETYEIPNNGAITYQHSTTGNDITNNFSALIGGRQEKIKQILVAGNMILIGFDESSKIFREITTKIDASLEEYIIKG